MRIKLIRFLKSAAVIDRSAIHDDHLVKFMNRYQLVRRLPQTQTPSPSASYSGVIRIFSKNQTWRHK